jgi:hypothetical protein
MEVELISEWRFVAETLLREDGYMSYGSLGECSEGEVIPDTYGLGIPFKVIGKTTRENAMRQFRRMATIIGAPEAELIPPPANFNFYKIIAAD